jgi:hypothetical protein
MAFTLEPAPHGDGARTHPAHRWPSCEAEWDALADCRSCGIAMLRLFIHSAEWVVRRVERIEFLDERTARRRMSVDYTSPADGTIRLSRGADELRILPLAVLRRKSLIKFDLRDENGRPMPLLGLRETQALTLSVARAWAAATLAGTEWEPTAAEPLPGSVERFLDGVVTGDQAGLDEAYAAMKGATEGPLAVLRRDPQFTAVLDRFASSFVLFTVDDGPVGARRIVKFAYDEPLTLLYSTSSYHGHGPAAKPPTYGKGSRWLSRWARAPMLAGLGLTPTVIRFPVPAAEQTTSFHLEVSAPPEVSIVEASLLAGLPNLYLSPADDPDEDRAAWKQVAADGPLRRRRRRPSFDYVKDAYPTVDLHVVDVPVGSLSRAQVKLRASPTGWLTTAAISLWLAFAILLVGALEGSARGDTAPSLLMTVAAAVIAALARPDPHRMVTRLLTLVRLLAGVSAVLTLAGAVVFAFGFADWLLVVFAALSFPPAACVTVAGWLSRRGGQEGLVRLSPWEQHLPYDAPLSGTDPDFHVELARELDEAEYPYDTAVRALGFDGPAIKVASSEGVRDRFPWSRDFHDVFQARLDQAARSNGARGAP